MHNDVDAVAVRPNNKDLPSKNRVWGFRTPARYRIRKAAAQAAESRRENRPTPTNNASGIRYFLLTDQVGTLRAVADTGGAIVKRIDYDSFGNIVADSNPAFSVPFGFAGGLHDRDTGLVRFGYRDYSPELGRFVAKDPIDFASGDTNLYAYVTNDPINYTDSQGLIIDTLLDVGFVLWDLYDIATDPCNRGEHVTDLGLDLAGFFIPGVTGLGKARRVLTDADALVQLAKEAKRKGISKEEASILLDWARDPNINVKPALDHINTTHWSGGPHIRIGPVNHIPVK